MNASQQIQITRDAQGNVFLAGDNNVVNLTVYQSASHQELEPPSTPSASLGPNPYRGLAAFYEDDADRFFGRDELIQELWNRFRDLHKTSNSGFARGRN